MTIQHVGQDEKHLLYAPTVQSRVAQKHFSTTEETGRDRRSLAGGKKREQIQGTGVGRGGGGRLAASKPSSRWLFHQELTKRKLRHLRGGEGVTLTSLQLDGAMWPVGTEEHPRRYLNISFVNTVVRGCFLSRCR